MKASARPTSGIHVLVFMLLVSVQAPWAAGNLTEEQLSAIRKKSEHYSNLGYAPLPVGIFPDTALLPGKNYVVFVYPFADEWRLPAKKQATLAQGTQLFFEPSVSLRVEGKLEAVYTSFSKLPREDLYLGDLVSDKQWGGIHVAKSGSLHLDGASLSGSSPVIQSEAPAEALTLECIQVPKQDSCAVRLGDECLFIREPQCFTLKKREAGQAGKSDSAPQATGIGKGDASSLSEESRTGRPGGYLRPALSWSSVGLGLATLGLAYATIHFHRQAINARDAVDAATTTGAAQAAAKDMDRNLDSRDAMFWTALGTGLLSTGLGVTVLVAF